MGAHVEYLADHVEIVPTGTPIGEAETDGTAVVIGGMDNMAVVETDPTAFALSILTARPGSPRIDLARLIADYDGWADRRAALSASEEWAAENGVIVDWSDSDDQGCDLADRLADALRALTTTPDPNTDTASSASVQHYIDTGRYLTHAEVAETAGETIKADAYGDGWTCLCGNTNDSDGFAPCDPDTALKIEPSTDGPWDGRSVVCLSCRRVMDQDSHRPNPAATDEDDVQLVTVTRGPRDDVNHMLDAN